jgi:hypothetical protein
VKLPCSPQTLGVAVAEDTVAEDCVYACREVVVEVTVLGDVIDEDVVDVLLLDCVERKELDVCEATVVKVEVREDVFEIGTAEDVLEVTLDVVGKGSVLVDEEPPEDVELDELLWLVAEVRTDEAEVVLIVEKPGTVYDRLAEVETELLKVLLEDEVVVVE